MPGTAYEDWIAEGYSEEEARSFAREADLERQGDLPFAGQRTDALSMRELWERGEGGESTGYHLLAPIATFIFGSSKVDKETGEVTKDEGLVDDIRDIGDGAVGKAIDGAKEVVNTITESAPSWLDQVSDKLADLASDAKALALTALGAYVAFILWRRF